MTLTDSRFTLLASSVADPNEFQTALALAMSEALGELQHIAAFERRPSRFQSSYPLEELDVRLESGAELRLVLKDLSEYALMGAAESAKPKFLRDPRRELCVYQSILPGTGLGTARYFGSVSDDGLGRCWLFIERVAGEELYQVGDFAVWEQVARWLARAHDLRLSARRTPYLLRYDADFYRLWMLRARAFAETNPSSGPGAANDLQRISAGYERIVQQLVALPHTFIHGEFYASNILVVRSPVAGEPVVRVCPVDWEMAAVGPGLADLAALTSGKWKDEERTLLAEAYFAELPASERWPSAWPEFQTALDCCRLHLALQWLGWSPYWEPPVEHAHNWLDEARQLADRLGI